MVNNEYFVIDVLFLLEKVNQEKHSPIPVAEFAHYVSELKANDNYEFQSEYDVSITYKCTMKF